MTKLIELKSDPPVFEEHIQHRKNFDLRTVRDRHFEAGDIVLMREFDRETLKYSGREFVCRILFVLLGPTYTLPEGDAILSLHPVIIQTEGNLKPKGEL